MWAKIKNKHFERWLPGYFRYLVAARARRARRPQGLKHVLFAVCDHYEPLWNGSRGKADIETGQKRVEQWYTDYPRLADRFRDADGRPPRHTFFFPAEEFHPSFFDRLDDLVRRGYGEVELHLHHDGDNEESLERVLRSALDTYAARGHFSRAPDGSVRYAFIHGNWALANGRPDGKQCGVDAELPLLFRTGCYADFTFPSCPDVTQPDRVNQIYWPEGDLSRRRAYEWGREARVGESFDDRLLLITGPLMVGRRGASYRPRIEYSALVRHDPVTPHRIQHWLDADIHVHGREDWLFVKVHTHGAQDGHSTSLLGEGGELMHQNLQAACNSGEYALHYVTAREMYNVARAAMDGKAGNPSDYLDYRLPPPPIAQSRA